LLHRIDLHDDRIDISIYVAVLLSERSDTGIDTSGEPAQMEAQLHHISMPVCRLRRGREVRLIISESMDANPATADPVLVRLIATAHAAQAAMHAAGDLQLIDIAKAQGFTEKYFTLLLRLATLDPGIVQAIVEGRQPALFTRQRLAKITNLPIDWASQRSALGFL